MLLVGDIDRGGIFAQMLGTLWLLEADERALVRGLVVNKFRGDLALFSDGVRILEEKGNVPVLGVLPYLKNLYLPDEDAVSIEAPPHAEPASPGQVDIAVLRLPRIANFDDFDVLRAEPGVRVRYVAAAHELGKPHVVIIPGTKSTIDDLDWLRQNGLAEAVIRFARQGGALVGICGGYQMLGETIDDPQHVESSVESTPGLGLLPIVTHFLGEKTTLRTRARIQSSEGWLASLAGQMLDGYEIHMGNTQGSQPWLEIISHDSHAVQYDGAVSADGQIWGCYLHGIFANEYFRRAWLENLGWQAASRAASQSDLLDRSLEALADAVEQALDMELLEKIIWES